MIKRIIFDIDDTLIPFPEYKEGYSSVLKKHNLKKTAEELYQAIGSYEMNKEFKFYDKEKLLNHINEVFKSKLTIDFIDDFLNMYNDLETFVDFEVIETLKLLAKKYELVALSNWFTESQEKRLEKAGIKKYLKKVYGSDLVYMKPNIESYKEAMGDKKIEECIIVGDSLELDIKVPNEMGMKTIFLNLKNEPNKYTQITKISDLKEML